MESKETSIKRLETLKDACLMRNLSELNLDNIYELYDSMLYKTFSGEFNDIFVSDYLNDSNRDEILTLASKYNSLCFYLGQFDNWIDSPNGATLSNLDLVAELLLKNYAYLIRLAKNGGEDVLKFISKFEGSELFKKGAIIAELLNNFYDEDVLETILIEMSKSDGNYKDFSDKQKLLLCESPEGLLYKVTDDKDVIITPVKELKSLFVKKYLGSDDSDYDLNNIDSNSFKEIIESLHLDYHNEYKK